MHAAGLQDSPVVPVSYNERTNVSLFVGFFASCVCCYRYCHSALSVLIFSLSHAKRLAGKNVSEMTYFVLNGT